MTFPVRFTKHAKALKQMPGGRMRGFASVLVTLAIGLMQVTLVTLVTLIATAAPAFAAWNLQQLMAALAQNKSGRATFVETKHIAILERPVESSGELLFTAPDRLEKRTFKPRAESLVVNGDELLVERGRQKYRLQLQAYPDLAAFIDSIRGTLTGDRKALERNFRLGLDGSAERWTLQLLPLDEKMLVAVRQIRISGVHDRVNSIEIMQSDGDRSVMAIEKVALP